MANGKIQLADGTVMLDLTSDTTSASTTLKGYTGHDKAGNPFTGSVEFRTVYTGSTDPSSSLGTNGDMYLKLV